MDEPIGTNTPSPYSETVPDPLAVQVGGDHYKTAAIQPIEFILVNDLSFVEGNVVKYVARWKTKGGVEDLRKARHYLDLYIQHLEKTNAA
jgi:hypothetical protein